MSDTGFFINIFLFFAATVCAQGWYILIKGQGTFDNLWTSGLLLSIVFMVSSSIVVFFPFYDVTFFFSILIFMNFATLYAYSFPKSIWPNIIWFPIIFLANIISLFHFFGFRERSFISFFVVTFLFSMINFPVIIRKIKHLESSSKKAVIIHVTFIAVFSALFPFFAGLSSLTFNPLYFKVFLTIAIPLTLILMGVTSYLNLNPGSGINRVNFPIIIISSLPMTVILKNLFSLRSVMLGYITSANFTFVALFLLFVLFNSAGVLVSFFSSLIEGYINRSRHFYQQYINTYKSEIEKVTATEELFDVFDKSIRYWFKEFRELKYIFFTDEIPTKVKSAYFVDASSFSISLNDSRFIHEQYFVKNSVDLPTEITTVSSEFGGNVFIPFVFRNELQGFVIIQSRKFSHSASSCIYTLLEITMNRYEKLLLFRSIIETEKKLDTLRHFQETGKMVSIIAHELRSPLSSIMFNMEVIKDSIFKQAEPDPEYLDISLKEIRRLNETVEKMLDYGRNIKLTVKEGDFTTFFDEVSRLFPSAPEQINFIENTNGRKFSFDWDMLKSVMINLISNSLQAIERSDKNGKVKVSAFRKRNRIVIEVADTGPGIPDEHRSSIFEPFYTTRKEGNGLGLATSEKIIKLSGGTISLKETSANGTVFQIILPVE